MANNRIDIRGAAKSVGARGARRTVWSGIDLTVREGERVGLTGPSGCGKSTLLNCIGLLESLDSGELRLDGEELSRASARTRMRHRRHSIGYLFQDYALIDNDTVAQNVLLAAPRAARRGRPGKRRLLDEALAAVGLAGRDEEKVFQLSGGEQQRVAMARLLARRPGIVLADEPTASLDRENATVILGHLEALAAEGAAVLIVSHDPWVIGQCDRSIELERHYGD